MKKFSKKARAYLKNVASEKIIFARAEDIPFLLQEYAKVGKKAIGLIGEDLYEEFLLQKNEKLKILKRIEWKDKKAVFRKPTLCLLGPKNKTMREIPKKARIYIATKYKRIANRYLKKYKKQGFKFQLFYVNGCIERSVSEGLADLVVDIVYSGRTMEKNNLKVLKKIMKSNLLIIGQRASIKPKEWIDRIPEYSPPLEERRNKLRLDFNENSLGCSLKALRSVKSVSEADISVYPEYVKFKQMLAKKLGLTEDELFLTNGSDEGIKLVMDSFINKDDGVIIPIPTFALFEIYAKAAGAKIIKVKYNKDLTFPTNKILSKICRKTKIIVIVSPNNPTGTSIRERDLEKILKKAQNSIVLLDEAYCWFLGRSFKEKIKKYSNLVITQTFSKAFGLAGLRIGYLIANKEIISLIKKVASPYNVNNIALIAAKAALEDKKFMKKYATEIAKGKKYVIEELKKLGVKTFQSDANFVLATFGEKCNAVYEQLYEKGILVRNVSSAPLLQNCLRITIGSKTQMQMIIKAVKEILQKKVILFDLDGVLVDVSGSYRMAIKKTAEYFTKGKVSFSEIQNFKEKGDFNNDWDLSEAIIFSREINVPKKQVIQKFQEYYLGKERLIDKEKLLLSNRKIKELSKKYRLGIVTGRPKNEALYVLRKFGAKKYFDVIVTLDDLPKGKDKPDPFGIKLALKKIGTSEATYIGDSIDDAKAARKAGIKFIGVMPPKTKSQTLEKLLKKEGAVKVFKIIKEMVIE